ncbi:MAG: aromatic ring-hydroxylating dioxygenase subunit alpha [Elusimicrobia bacterium]|nr:aromatic ring-hydroxylating dioxygenase subunit alpha [Elusimicrobiota bacterium]
MSLKDYWYIACESRELREKPLARVIMGEPVVVFRGPDGAPAVLNDRCAHRNMALSLGRVTDKGLQCGYHGWTYDAAGVCRFVPAQGEGARLPRIEVPRKPVCEQDGYVWTCLGAPVSVKPFGFPHLGEAGWTSFTMQNEFAGSPENCLENFLDCPHTVFVHKGWFRTPDTRQLSALVRRDDDSVEVRFQDEPISPSVVSWLLFPKGKELKHTDRFLLPSISRVDYVFGPDRHFIITSQCTPVSEHASRVYTVINYRFGSVGALVRLFFEPLCRRIIAQDVDILRDQSDNLKRFCGEKFAHLETDLLGLEIRRLRERAERGETAAPAPLEREVTIRF